MTQLTLVADHKNGGAKTLEAHLLASFTAVLQGQRYQLSVTRVLNESVPNLTHSKSGRSMGAVQLRESQASLGDSRQAGKLTLARLIRFHGEARVASALRAAELQTL